MYWFDSIDFTFVPVCFNLQALVLINFLFQSGMQRAVVISVCCYLLFSRLRVSQFFLGFWFTLYLPAIWQINNAGTNKGFRPLMQFTDGDIKQVLNIFIVIDNSRFFNKQIRFPIQNLSSLLEYWKHQLLLSCHIFYQDQILIITCLKALH